MITFYRVSIYEDSSNSSQTARRGMPSGSFSIISNEYANLAMSPGVRENLEPEAGHPAKHWCSERSFIAAGNGRRLEYLSGEVAGVRARNKLRDLEELLPGQ